MKRDELYITIEPDDIKRTAFTLVNSSDLKNYKDDHYTWSMKVSGSVEHINMLGDGGVICYGGNIGSIDVRNGRLNISHNATVSNIRELGGWVSYDDISTIHFMTSVLQGSIVTTPFTIHHVTTFKDCEILNEGTVYEYGVLKDSHIGKNGYVLAKAHSIVDSVVVSDGGHLFAEDKAHLKNIYIAKGGSISICPRTHTHHVTACTGSTVYVNPKVKEESLKRIKMEEGVEVKTHDEEFDRFVKFPKEPGPVITDDKTDGDSDSFAFLAKADDLNDQSDLYLTLYTTTDKVEDFEFEYLLVHILNHNYKLYCKMDWWNGDSKPCKLENPYKFMNPLDPRDKVTFEYRGLLHLKDCYLVDTETNMSVGDLDFLTKADIFGMTYRSTKDFRCLIDKNGALFRQKNLYVCDEPLCYERFGDPECKPIDDSRYDWQKEAKELSVQYPSNLVIGGYSANNVCTLREIYLEYNRFGYDKPITCHIGFKNATVNFNPETNYMTVRLIDWGLWNPEDQSVFEHDCILDSIKITGWGYDHDTKGFYVPHFSEVWYNGRKVNMAEKTENSRIINFLDYGVMISTTKPMLNALKNIPNETKDVLTKSLDDTIDDVENVISSNLVIHCRTNYQDSYISWIEVEFPGVDKIEKSIYIAFWNKPEISYNPVTNIYSFIFKDQDWSLRQIDDENKVSDRNKSWIKDAKITHISFHEELPENFQFDLIDFKYDGEKIAGPPSVMYGVWGTLDNPNTTESKRSIGLYDPNEDTKLHSEKKNNGFFTIGPNTQHYWNTPVCTFKPDGDIHLNSTLMDMSKKVEVTSIVINPGDDKFDFCDEDTAYGPTISCKPTESKASEIGLDNVFSDVPHLTLRCRTNYPTSFVSWMEVDFPGEAWAQSMRSAYIGFFAKPEITYNSSIDAYLFTFKSWYLRSMRRCDGVSHDTEFLKAEEIQKAKITHISFASSIPDDFQFDLLDVRYGNRKIDGSDYVKYGVWNMEDNPAKVKSRKSIYLYDPNTSRKKKEEVVKNLKDAVEKTTQKALAEKNLKPKAEKELQDDTVDYSTVNWYKQPDDEVPVHKETVYKKIITCDMYPLNNIQVRSLSEKEVQMGAFEDKSPKKEYYPVNFCTDLHIEGSTASKVTVLDGGYVWLHSGYVDDIWVYPGGSVRIDSSECYGNIYECGGYVDFDGDEQNTVNGNDVYDLVLDNQMSTVHKGTTFFRVRIQNGVTLIVRGEVDYLIAEREATDCNEVQVMDGGTLKKSCVEAGTKIVAFSGSTLEDVTVVRGGVLQIFKGAQIKHCDICHGGALEVAEDVDRNAEWFHKEIFQHLGSTVRTLKLDLFDEEDDVE